MLKRNREVDGENDEDGLPRGTNEGGSDGYTRYQHCMERI